MHMPLTFDQDQYCMHKHAIIQNAFSCVRNDHLHIENAVPMTKMRVLEPMGEQIWQNFGKGRLKICKYALLGSSLINNFFFKDLTCMHAERSSHKQNATEQLHF